MGEVNTSSTPRTWTPQQEQALQLLSDVTRGYTRKSVAQMVGVDRTSIYNWLAIPEFEADLDKRARVRAEAVLKRAAAYEGRRLALRMAVLEEIQHRVEAMLENPELVKLETLLELLRELRDAGNKMPDLEKLMLHVTTTHTIDEQAIERITALRDSILRIRDVVRDRLGTADRN